MPWPPGDGAGETPKLAMDRRSSTRDEERDALGLMDWNCANHKKWRVPIKGRDENGVAEDEDRESHHDVCQGSERR